MSCEIFSDTCYEHEARAVNQLDINNKSKTQLYKYSGKCILIYYERVT
jgi:hypothetical protein